MNPSKGARPLLGDGAFFFLVFSVLFLVFFRPAGAFHLAAQNDDGCYIKALGSFLNFPANSLCYGKSYHAPGAPLLWIPAGLLAKTLAWATGTDEVSWAAPWVAVYSFVLLGTAAWVAGHWLRTALAGISLKPVSKNSLAIALLLNAPVLYYAIQWAIMPHTAQLLLAVTTCALLRTRSWKWSMLSAAALCLVRYNDVPAILLPLAKYYDLRRESDLPVSLSRRGAWILGAIALTLLSIVSWIAFFHGYGPTHLQSLLRNLHPRAFSFFLFDSASGMLWASPWWLATILFGALKLRSLSWQARAAWLWMIVEMLTAVAWGGTGGDFGYRYLIGSYAAGILIWLELLRNSSERMRKAWVFFSLAGALWMTFQISAFGMIPSLAAKAPRAPVTHALLGPAIMPPHFFLESLRHALDPEIYKYFLLNSPVGVFFASFFHSNDPSIVIFAVQGPDLIVTTLSLIVTTCFIALYPLRRAGA